MPDRIRTLVKRISETRPIQGSRRQAIAQELHALRGELDVRAAPDQARSLDAALLLLEFMNRSQDVATAETLQIVASLVSTIDERMVRASLPQAAQPGQPVQHQPIQPGHQSVQPIQHQPVQTFQPHQPAPAALPARVQPAAAPAEVAQHPDLRMTQETLLGTILLQAGVISPETLSRALQLHTSSRLALGQCLVQLGAASAEQIAGAIAYQDRVREGERAPPVETTPGAGRFDLRLTSKQRGFVQSMHNQVLGEVLIRLGTITREQLDRALQVQRAASVHIGQALVEIGAASWDQIKRGLEVQKQLRRGAA